MCKRMNECGCVKIGPIMLQCFHKGRRLKENVGPSFGEFDE
jgi:hypothetical protein